MTHRHAAIACAFEPEELEPLLAEAGIEQTILVQSDCSDEDTDALFEYAAGYGWVAAVVAWVPLDDQPRAAERLDELGSRPKLRGIRHLIHDESDPHWILRAAVLESLSLLEARGLILELPAVFPRHLGDVPQLARSFPRLSIVIDHLGKPPVGEGFHDWARQLSGAAEFPNVAAKVSGLAAARDLRPALEVALDAFGPDRLLCGSDWPVSLLHDGYVQVWAKTRRALEQLAPETLDLLLAGTARRLYSLN